MCKVIYGLIGFAAIAFALAVLAALFGFNPFSVGAEALSRASNNLALIAIALAVCYKKEPTAS
jgi:hypothetical protein